MPIQVCEIDNRPGKKWGDGGTCYPYESGNAASETAATKKALAQGIASGDIDVNSEEMQEYRDLIEFAKLKRVEIMTPGTHNGVPIDEQVIRQMERETNESLPFLTSQIGKAAYDENPSLNLKGKLIPAVIDLNHQKDLPKSFIDMVKSATMRVFSEVENGITKLFAEFDGVPDDVAEFLENKYNNRSVEIMPPFFDPLLKKVQHWAIRAVGFLDHTMPPAVDGMSPSFVVEFARRDEVMALSCAIQPLKEVQAMADTTKEDVKNPQHAPAGAIEPKTPAQDQREPSRELLEMRKEIEEFKARMKAAEDRAALAEQERDESRKKSQEQDVLMFLKQCEHDGIAIAALGDGVKEQLLALPDKEVVLFRDAKGEDMKLSPREFWKRYIQHNAPKVPRTELMPGSEQNLSILEMQKNLVEEKKAEILKQNPNMKPELAFAKAYDMAINAAPQLYN